MSLPKDGGLDTTPPAVAALTPSGEPCPAGPDVPREGSRDVQNRGKVISVPHDWCKSTDSPVPYKIWCWQSDAGNLANSVRQTDCRSHVQGSYVRECYGDEPGKGGGVKSGTCQAECTPITWSSSVRAEGRPMVRRFDKWHMNHGNTWGCLENPEDTGTYAAPKVQLIKSQLSALSGADGNTPGAASLRGNVQLAYDPVGTSDAPPPGSGQGAPPQTQTQTQGAPPSNGNPPPPADTMAPPPIPSFKLPLTPSSPATMEAMGYLDKWLKKNVNDPLDWPSKGLMRKDNSRPLTEEDKKLFRQLEELQHSNVVRVTKRDSRRECDCIIGTYKSGESKCSACDGNFHHIVPDMVYRTGERPQLEADKNSTKNRIPNAPTLNKGMSVCIDPQDHSSGAEGLHGKLRGQLAGLPSQVKGTAPLGDIVGKSKQSLDDIPGLSADCKSKAKSAVDQQVKSQGLSPNQPGRTIEKPLPSPDATTKMLQGHY